MPSTFLIDFENIQPKDAHLIKPDDKIFVFLGEKNNSLKKDLVIALQPLGKNVKYITTNGSGKNSLDFHIAFYLGKLSHNNDLSELVVISNDKGFDNLLLHLKDRKVKCSRVSSFTEYYNPEKTIKKPLENNKNTSVKNEKVKSTQTVSNPKANPKRSSPKLTFEQHLAIFMEFLKNNIKIRPSNLLKLEGVIKNRYKKKFTEEEMKEFVSKVLSSGSVIKDDKNKLNYHF